MQKYEKERNLLEYIKGKSNFVVSFTHFYYLCLMKITQTLFILLGCLLGSLNIVPAHAQSIEQLEKSLHAIETDLQQKSLEYSWRLTDDYLEFCNTFDKLISISSDDYLKVLSYEKKPKEIAPQEQAYEKAKNELEKYLGTYDEYKKIESMGKEVMSEEGRKDLSAAKNNFYNLLWKDDEKYRELRNKDQAELKKYRMAIVRYMLNEYKAKKMVMPTSFINYKDKDNLLSNNTNLKRLSLEIRQLEDLQRQIIRQIQKKKYNIEDTEKTPVNN